MASILLTSVAASHTLLVRKTQRPQCAQLASVSIISGAQRFVTIKAEKRSTLSHCFKTPISCSIAQPETLKVVQATIASQLSIDESTVAPATKFADLGADSLDTVEIMMALEETFGVSIGESGAENIATVQDAADLIEKVKAIA
nr:acyl carrier protein 1, chloroplastic-like [Tanacetum cinerariifolium]